MTNVSRLRRIGITAAAVAITGMWLPASVAQGQAAAATVTIGVDNVNPAGHNFEYTDYFPRAGVNVHAGDVVHFAWNPGASSDSLHTATLLKSGETPQQADAANPPLIPDADDGPASPPLQNPAVFGPTNPPPGSGAPGACGDAATPCTFDGTHDLSSGANTAGSDFSVRLAPTLGVGTYTVTCLIHPGMFGTFSVVAGTVPDSTPAELSAGSASQYSADTAEATAAEAGAHATSTPNPDGTHTIHAFAGVGTAHTEVLEMLPKDLQVAKGDKVNWLAPSAKEIHTVTFPAGNAGDPIDPFSLPPQCEGAKADTPAPGANPPDFGCPGGPPAAESPTLVTPVGPTTLHITGYRTAGADGGTFDFNAPFFGSQGGKFIPAPITGITQTSDGQGYWEVGSDGSVFSFGNAPFLGSLNGVHLARPIVGMAASPLNNAYVLAGADGGVFTFGAVPFLGSAASLHLAAPVVGVGVGGRGGPGYWLAGADGGVFNFGAAPFLGSAATVHLAKPIVGMAVTPDGGGFWLVASDGGVFTYGDAAFYGSTGAMHLNSPIVGITPTATGQGYWLVGADGGVFSFGDAQFFGSTGGMRLNAPVVGIAGLPGTVATSGVIGSFTGAGLPTNYTFTVADAGTYTYQCRIHDGMRGVIHVG